MSARLSQRRKHRPVPDNSLLGSLLDPIDRLAETIYSVLILLTFTLAFRIFKLGGAPDPSDPGVAMTELFVAALGATVAWGLIDGLMHVLLEIFQRGERHRLLQLIQTAESERAGVAVIAEELDYVLEPIADESDRTALYHSVFARLQASQPRPVGIKRSDLAGALGCVIVSVLAVLPSLLPLILIRSDPNLAIRVSNSVSFVVLFIAGYRWGQYTGADPLRTGLLLVVVAVLMVAIAIPLGG